MPIYQQPFSSLATPKEAWIRITEYLKRTLPNSIFQKWIVPINARGKEEEIILGVPDLEFYQGLLEDLWKPIENAKQSVPGLDRYCLRIEIDGQTTSSAIITEEKDDIENLESQKSKVMNRPTNPLNNKYLFSSFVSGESNRFAQAACEAVADDPGNTYNPLFIYGGTGLGKTHLLHAIGNKILRRNPSAVVTYISSERFMNEMIYCLRFKKMWDFRQKYRHCDVFLVDDIQFISRKERTQEEFFHTFNALYEQKKQVVITSDLFPQDIPDIEDRLRNRFQWGLIADIQQPDFEHRMAILYNKAEALGIYVDPEVAEYIASQAKRNIRELEGALHRMAAFSSLQGKNISMALAQETLSNVLGDPHKKITIESIQKIVAEHFKVRVVDLKSKKRLRTLTLPRQIAMYLSRQKVNASYPDIGSRFGGKDHTTVMHAVKKITKEKTNLNIKTELDVLERKIEQMC